MRLDNSKVVLTESFIDSADKRAHVYQRSRRARRCLDTSNKPLFERVGASWIVRDMSVCMYQPYCSKLDRWPCHVTVAERKACFLQGCFGPVTRHAYPSCRNLTEKITFWSTMTGILAIKLTLQGMVCCHVFRNRAIGLIYYVCVLPKRGPFANFPAAWFM